MKPYRKTCHSGELLTNLNITVLEIIYLFGFLTVDEILIYFFPKVFRIRKSRGLIFTHGSCVLLSEKMA